MENKRLPVIMVSICLGVVFTLLLLTACGPSAPASSSATSGQPPAAKQAVQIQIHGASSGAPGQLMTFAWGDLINKNSAWLKANVTEESAPGASAPLFQKSADKRSNSMLFAIAAQPDGWSKGLPPLTADTPYTTWRFVARSLCNPILMVTLNPNIKTLADLNGKNVGITQKVQPTGAATVNILQYGVGNLDKIGKLIELNPATAKDALLNGQVEAAVFPFSSDAPMWGLPPQVEEIAASKKVYYVDFTKEAIDKAFAQAPFPYLPPQFVPEKTYGPDQKAFWGLANHTFYVADAAMSDDIVYEAVRIMYEHTGDFAQYHVMGKGITKELLPQTVYKENQIHPGALKFYKEKGLKIGLPQ